MKLDQKCYECLRKLVHQAAELATADMQIQQDAVARGEQILKDNFSSNEVSIVVATKIHNAIKDITGNPDPYRTLKDREIAVAHELYNEINGKYQDGFEGLLKLAAVGNNLDFFRPVESIKKDIRKAVTFTINDAALLKAKLEKAEKVLYLADNAGEVYFDLPLLAWMRQFTRVIYVVKSYPVQNDITIEEVKRLELEEAVSEVMTTGTATPGIDFSQASDQFKHEFETADIIFAKGMGYYESLSELTDRDRIFYCLMAKCQPVADALKVPLNSFVAMLR
jgi:damage-control phosphatase, subfamily I